MARSDWGLFVRLSPRIIVRCLLDGCYGSTSRFDGFIPGTVSFKTNIFVAHLRLAVPTITIGLRLGEAQSIHLRTRFRLRAAAPRQYCSGIEIVGAEDTQWRRRFVIKQPVFLPVVALTIWWVESVYTNLSVVVVLGFVNPQRGVTFNTSVNNSLLLLGLMYPCHRHRVDVVWYLRKI